jgi:putative transposase
MPGLPHHVTHRGNNGRRVFMEGEDFRLYLRILRRKLRDHGVSLWAYCLMPNHVHLVVLPRNREALAHSIGRAHHGFALFFNRNRSRRGHLWLERFYSCPMDHTHALRALVYVETNPVRAGLEADPWDYPWSSARAHVTGSDPAVILAMGEGPAAAEGLARWRQRLAASCPRQDADLLRRQTRTGMPFGPPAFLARVVEEHGRAWTPQRRRRALEVEGRRAGREGRTR